MILISPIKVRQMPPPAGVNANQRTNYKYTPSMRNPPAQAVAIPPQAAVQAVHVKGKFIISRVLTYPIFSSFILIIFYSFFKYIFFSFFLFYYWKFGEKIA